MKHKLKKMNKRDHKIKEQLNALDNEEEHLKHDLKKLKHDYHIDFKHLVNELKYYKECNLSDAYGTFYSMNTQIVPDGQLFMIENELNTKHIKHADNSPNVIVLECGVYVVNFTVSLTDVGNVALYVNNILDTTSITTGKTININRILILNKDDVLSFKNHLTGNPLVTLPNSKNLELTMWKIAKHHKYD
jgi:hypothetical protein